VCIKDSIRLKTNATVKAVFATCLALSLAPAGLAAADELVYPSHLMVDQEVTVAARITGIVQDILVDRGTAVVKGQPVVRLDAREFEQDEHEAKEQMELSRVEYDRAKSLSESKVMSASDLDEKKAQYQVAVARWEKAKAVLDYTVIRAPFAGIVTEKYARVGQKVIEDQNVPLIKITASEPLLARVYLPEEQLLHVRRGDEVEIIPDRFPDAHTTGVVTFISPTVDAASGTFQVIVNVRKQPSQAELRPGVGVKVRFRNPKS